MTIDPNTVPDWAIEEALKRLGWENWPIREVRRCATGKWSAAEAVMFAASLIEESATLRRGIELAKGGSNV